MPHSAVFAFGAIILAAGQSRRMGQPKLLLSWGETSILGHLIKQWTALGAAQIGVVCAAGDQGIGAELARLRFTASNRIENPAPERGMFSSIQCAAFWPGWKADLTHWAIVLGDQPHLSHGTLFKLIDFAKAHPQQICLPWHGGHRRHPVLLPKPAFVQLADSPAPDLKAFLDTMSGDILGCELDDAALDWDLNRPEDYAKAVALAVVKSKT